MTDLYLFLNLLFYDAPKRIYDFLSRSDTVDDAKRLLVEFLSVTEVTPEMRSICERVSAQFDAGREYARLEAAGVTLLTLDDPKYPLGLKEIHHAPVLLYVNGDVSFLNRPMLSVVGTRKMSTYGRQALEAIVPDLLSRFLIVSGMAMGVDAMAHDLALTNGMPTVAVLGTGVDQIYPRTNRDLYRRISENGVLLSEYPLGTGVRPYRFPQRNRIVSGLSRGVLVCEAGENSGSLITARLAMEENRDVFVVPGSIFSKQLLGSHRLVQDGAKLVVSHRDILNEYDDILGDGSVTQSLFEAPTVDAAANLPDLTPSEAAIWNGLGSEPLSMEVLLKKTGVSVHEAMQILTFFEVNGQVEQLPGKQYRRRV